MRTFQKIMRVSTDTSLKAWSCVGGGREGGGGRREEGG